MHPGWGPPTHDRAPRLRPFVRPEANLIARMAEGRDVPAAVVFLVVFVTLGVAAAALGGAAPVLATALGVAAAAWAGIVVVSAHRDVIGPPFWKVGGVAIPDAELARLAEIDARFRFAEERLDHVPAGVSWADLRSEVAALRWEAVQHAAKVGQIDLELAELGYAGEGGPQAVLRRTLQQQRAEHDAIVRGVLHEADGLARQVGRAAAAAKVVLAQHGRLPALDAVLPTRRAIVAAGALAEARERLQLLADTWSELDQSGELTAAAAAELPPVTGADTARRARRRG